MSTTTRETPRRPLPHRTHAHPTATHPTALRHAVTHPTATRPTVAGRTVAAVTAALAGAALLAVAPSTAHASSRDGDSARSLSMTADSRMARELTLRATTARFGTAFSGAVVDASTDTVIWSKNGSTALMPASTTKLVTAANALTVLGPTRRFTTQVRAGSSNDRVIVQGAGDPSLSSAQLDGMARTVAATLKARGLSTAAVRVHVDDDVFPTPTLATGWKSSYVPGSITPVRGLVRDQSSSSDTSADVGRYFRDRLKAHGIAGAGYAGRANAASGSAVLASSQGSAVSTSVNRMLLVSDNEIAEALHKLVGIATGKGATWSGARAAQASALSRQGLSATALHDGSGLSRSDRLSAVQLARLVDRGVDTANTALWPMRSAEGMPTAGRTGTLSASSQRFVTAPSKCAAGRLWAKTGRLSDVVALAGFTKGADGRVKVFAFVVNGRTSTTALKQGVDLLAATVNGCY